MEHHMSTVITQPNPTQANGSLNTVQMDESIFRNPLPPVDQIVAAINKDGFIRIDNCFQESFLDSVKADVAANRFFVNRNGLSGCYSNTQYYFVNLMAVSRSFVSLIVSKQLRSVLKSYFADGCRMKALRYYETYGGHHMQWHTDNKTSSGFAQIPGLIFIFYAEDVADGEFQYVRGSHEWSVKSGMNDYTDEFIEKNYGDKIESFKGSAGTLVIYNTYGIHRARPVKDRNYVRKSMFFQVDEDVSNGEPLVINPSLFPQSAFDDGWLFTFLGFGKPAKNRIYPLTDAGDLTLSSFAKISANFAAHRPKRKLISMLPNSLKQRIKGTARK
jgi:hypothetical protein